MRINRENIWEIWEGIIGKFLSIRNRLKPRLQMRTHTQNLILMDKSNNYYKETLQFSNIL